MHACHFCFRLCSSLWRHHGRPSPPLQMFLCYPGSRMSESDQSQRSQAKSEADQTLLGVAPPRVDSAIDASQRVPVYVRSGTVSDADMPSSPRAAQSINLQQVPVHAADGQRAWSNASSGGAGARVLELARRRPVLWMVLTPALLAGLLILAARHAPSTTGQAQPIGSAEPAPSAAAPAANQERVPSVSIAELEAKPASALSARELVLLAEARSERQLTAANALREKIEADPALAKDGSVTSELTRLAANDRTAPTALAGMAALESPTGADLLYETWTATAQRSDTTELARALLYSPELRARTSPALAVALALRAAERCDQYQAILPEALKAGDRRSVHLLAKLTNKRGCGPKKTADCYPCLRQHGDELTATINAVKSRRPPSYSAQ